MDSSDNATNMKLITLKKFFIFNSNYGSTEGEVNQLDFVDCVNLLLHFQNNLTFTFTFLK